MKNIKHHGHYQLGRVTIYRSKTAAIKDFHRNRGRVSYCESGWVAKCACGETSGYALLDKGYKPILSFGTCRQCGRS